METHVLNGDALASKFPFEGNIVICREALVDGPVSREGGLESFWHNRAKFITDNFANEAEVDYNNFVRSQFEKLKAIDQTAICFWFEHDLFCQANLWFSIFFVHEAKLRVPLYIVMPPRDGKDLWSGFGRMKSDDLLQCYLNKVQMRAEDVGLGVALWDAFQAGRLEELRSLSKNPSRCFPLLNEVCEAHLARFAERGLGRPHRVLQSILNSGVRDFDSIFKQFWQTEGIYGFGDTQVKQMLSEVDPSYS